MSECSRGPCSRRENGPMNDEILRIVDANLNRASEGVRVLEETARLVWNDPVLSADLKDLRHAIAEDRKSVV